MTNILTISKFIDLRRSFIYRIYFFINSNKLKSFNKYSKNRTQHVNTNNFTDKQNIKQIAENALTIHGNSILRLAYSYLHNISDAEDIVQDTLIQLIVSSPCFESIEHEKAWLMRVAINLSKNRIKYIKRRETCELNDALIGDNEPDVAFVWEAVNALPLRYREIIHLYYHEEYSTSQIANLLCKNESTVRSLLARGRTQLKQILKEVYGYEE